MFRPKHFDLTDLPEMHSIIRTNGFAPLITGGADGLVATHLPLYLIADTGDAAGDIGHGVLWGHFSKANEHWKILDGATEAMAIFQGAHTYISPGWYETAKSVPTWNYDAVHAYGRPRIMEDPDAVIARLTSMSDQYEEGRDHARTNGPWRIDSLPDVFVQGQLKGIVAFEMPIERIEGKRKMSQNRKPGDVAGAVKGLRASGNASDAAVADLTEAANKDRL